MPASESQAAVPRDCEWEGALAPSCREILSMSPSASSAEDSAVDPTFGQRSCGQFEPIRVTSRRQTLLEARNNMTCWMVRETPRQAGQSACGPRREEKYSTHLDHVSILSARLGTSVPTARKDRAITCARSRASPAPFQTVRAHSSTCGAAKSVSTASAGMGGLARSGGSRR